MFVQSILNKVWTGQQASRPKKAVFLYFSQGELVIVFRQLAPHFIKMLTNIKLTDMFGKIGVEVFSKNRIHRSGVLNTWAVERMASVSCSSCMSFCQ